MQKIIKSFSYAFDGIKLCSKNELNFKVHLFFASITIALGLFFSINSIEWAIILLCIGIVISAELFNTAIEFICNKMEPNFNKSIQQIKDISAAAVFVVAIFSAIIGLIIFIPKIL